MTVADVLLARLRVWGLLAAWPRAKDDPQFVQGRHQEMAAFEAVLGGDDDPVGFVRHGIKQKAHQSIPGEKEQ